MVNLQTGELTPSAITNASGDIEGLSCNGTQMAIEYPTIRIDENSSIIEGNSSTTILIFSLTLSKPAVKDIFLSYAITDETTTAGEDYIIESNLTIIILKDAQSATISIKIKGDEELEDNETFLINLTNAQNAVIDSSSSMRGIVINDDLPKELKVIGEFRFDNCEDEWKTDSSSNNNSIVGGTKVTIPTDDNKIYMSNSISSYDNSDAKIPHHPSYEIDEGTISMLVYDHHNVSTYRYNLLEKGNLLIKTVQVNGDNKKGSIDITLNGHTIHTNEIYWTTENQGDDFDTQWVDMTFTFGSKGMKLYINGELKGSNSYTGGLVENSSDFILPNISGYYDELYIFEEQAIASQVEELYNNGINNKNIDGTDREAIVCEDLTPTIYISNQEIIEGNNSTTNLDFTVSLDKVPNETVSFDYIILNGDNSDNTKNAYRPNDFIADENSTHVILDGLTQIYTIPVPIVGDETIEDNETFRVVLSNIEGAYEGAITAIGTIINDDVENVEENNTTDLDQDNDGILDSIEYGTCSTGVETLMSFDDFGQGGRTTTPYTTYCYEDGDGYSSCQDEKGIAYWAGSTHTNDGEYTVVQHPKPDASGFSSWSTQGDHTGN
jgi:hypothetical protein